MKKILTFVDGHRRNVTIRLGIIFRIISLMVIWTRLRGQVRVNKELLSQKAGIWQQANDPITRMGCLVIEKTVSFSQFDSIFWF